LEKNSRRNILPALDKAQILENLQLLPNLVLSGDIGDTGNVIRQGKWYPSPGGRGQGCAQQHRREAMGKEEKRFPPPKNKSATPLPKSNFLDGLIPER
jgi:hypothetical protein